MLKIWVLTLLQNIEEIAGETNKGLTFSSEVCLSSLARTPQLSLLQIIISKSVSTVTRPCSRQLFPYYQNIVQIITDLISVVTLCLIFADLAHDIFVVAVVPM